MREPHPTGPLSGDASRLVVFRQHELDSKLSQPPCHTLPKNCPTISMFSSPQQPSRRSRCPRETRTSTSTAAWPPGFFNPKRARARAWAWAWAWAEAEVEAGREERQGRNLLHGTSFLFAFSLRLGIHNGRLASQWGTRQLRTNSA